jgi:hypothetical protein
MVLGSFWDVIKSRISFLSELFYSAPDRQRHIDIMHTRARAYVRTFVSVSVCVREREKD